MLFDDEQASSEADDLFEWFFTTPEYRRDRNLQRSVEAAADEAAYQRRENARLAASFQERQTETMGQLGSLEERMEAYFELDTLRDGMDPVTKGMRAHAASMIQRLGSGQRPEPMEVGDGGYELPYAMNAVRGYVLGEPDPEALATAQRLDPSSLTLVVAAVAGLGNGKAVADLLPEVLASDGTLNPAQATIFRGVAAGAYGPDALRGLRGTIAPVLRDDWKDWLGADGDAPARLREAVTGKPAPKEPTLVEWRPDRQTEATPTPAATGPDLAPLKSLAGQLIMQGRRDERPTLERLAALSKVAFGMGDAPERGGIDLTDTVRELLLSPDTPVDQRRELVSWVAEPFRTAVRELTPTDNLPALAEDDTTARIAKLEGEAQPAVAAARQRAMVWAIVAVVAGVVAACALAGAIFGRSWWPVLLVIAGPIAAFVALRQRSAARDTEDVAVAELARQRREITESRDEAVTEHARAASSRERDLAHLAVVEDTLRDL